MRVPTEKQYEKLRLLGAGWVVISGMSGERRLWRSLVTNGWVSMDDPEHENGLRITADGFRALADAVDRYGWPEPAPTATRIQPKREQKLRAARDEARIERDVAREKMRANAVTIDRVRRALNGQATL